MTENFSLEDLKQKYNNSKSFRISTIAIGSVALIILGYLGYRQFMWKPENEKSKSSYYVALNAVTNEDQNATADTSKASAKNDPIKKLQKSVKKYDGKIGGEVSKYLLATQYMRKGKYKEALTLLESVSVEDTYVSVQVVGLQGDCQSELNKFEDAYELYKTAANMNANNFTSPMYLFKAGLVAEQLKKYDLAKSHFETIAVQYPKSFYAKEKNLEAYIARNAQ
ncbi:tetratricopeptide repeat protein [Crocinitomicaceae bacterium]|nr:tetratricopeptide repeat protein [Crocinitomicaceae bacterium]MDB4606432.1 tetratricopeptide repeat protein [Crocinitomicaceae bacterium]